MRRLQSHAFSEKALSAQETVIQGYVHQFIKGLGQQAEASKTGTVSLGSWFNFATFDIIGDLAFAESFDCLEKGVMNPVTKPSLFSLPSTSSIGLLPCISPSLVHTSLPKHSTNSL
jgi:hypothetical protein